MNRRSRKTARLWLSAILLISVGCASTPCVPTIETVTVNVPVPVLVPVAPLPPVVLPEWPEMPADLRLLANWCAEMVATAKTREALLRAAVAERDAAIKSTAHE